MRNNLNEYLKPVQLFITFLEVTIPSIIEVNSSSVIPKGITSYYNNSFSQL